MPNMQMGCRSRLVLEKLAFEVGRQMEDTLRAPLPDRLQRLADELEGYAEWRDVGSSSPTPPARPPRDPFAERGLLVSGDEPFRFN